MHFSSTPLVLHVPLIHLITLITSRGAGGGGGELCGCSGQQILRGTKFGGKMHILKENFNFLRSANFKLLSRI
jgi:hypothetical protein